MKKNFDAFISYSHSAVEEVAEALHLWLHRYAKPWWRRRAVRVFRDQTDLSAEPAAWSAIASALDASEWLILIASPKAAESKWVMREVRLWLGDRDAHTRPRAELLLPVPEIDRKRVSKLLIAVVDGEIRWMDAVAGMAPDFDWDRTTALPRCLSGVFDAEPLWVDLRAIATEQKHGRRLDRSNPTFMSAVARISAKIRDLDLGELIGEDSRLHRRAIRTAWAAIVSLAVLVGVAIVLAVVALNKATAAENARDRVAAGLATQLTAAGDPSAAIAVALSAMPQEKWFGLGDRQVIPEVRLALVDALLQHRELRVLWGHTSIVNSATFSPEGNRVVTASHDGTVRVWNSEDGTLQLILRAPERRAAMIDATFSPDGRRIITGVSGGDNKARIWDATTGEELLSLLPHNSAIYSVAFSTDGKQVVTGSHDGTARIWKIEGGPEIKRFPHVGRYLGAVNTAIFSADKRFVLTSDQREARISDSATGRQLQAFRVEGTYIAAVALSPDEGSVAAASGDGITRVWARDSECDPVELTGHSDAVTDVAYSPNGDRIATSSLDGTIRIWNPETRVEVIEIEGHDYDAEQGVPAAYVNSVSFSHDGRRVVTASHDYTARIWDAEKGADLLVFRGHANQNEVAFHGEKIVTLGAGSGSIWDPESRNESESFSGGYRSVGRSSLADNGARAFFATSERAWILEVQTGIDVPIDLTGFIAAAAFSPDGELLVTVERENGVYRLRAWEASTGAERTLGKPIGVSGEVKAVAISSDGRRIVAGQVNNTFDLWNARVGEKIATLDDNGGGVKDVSFSRNSDRVLTVTNSWARLWKAENGDRVLGENGTQVVFEHNKIPNRWLNSATLTKDGRRVITGHDDRTAMIWDVTTGEVVAVLREHDAKVRNAIFSPDGKYAVTISAAGTITRWPHYRTDEELIERGRAVVDALNPLTVREKCLYDFDVEGCELYR